MEAMEIVKTELSGILETAGESGVTEGQAVAAIVKHGIDYHTALDSLRKIYKEVGAERTPEHMGAVICYRKANKVADKPKETPAEAIARGVAKRTVNEYKTLEIINRYRRR